MKTALASLVLASTALASSATAQNTWLVDPGPGGHFDTVHEAAASTMVKPFDLLLIVAGPSPYMGPFEPNKPLRLQGIGPTQPSVGAADIFFQPGFSASNVRFSSLTVGFCGGLVHLDRCTIGAPHAGFASETTALQVSNTQQVLITRSTVRGYAQSVTGGPAVNLSSTLARIVDCEIHGGRATSAGAEAGVGGVGLRMSDTDAWIAGTSILGGDGQHGTGGGGVSGQAVTLEDGSTLDLRGSSAHLVRPGYDDPLAQGINAKVVEALTPDSHAVMSGVTVLGTGDHAPHPYVVPFLEIDGPVAPGAVAHANVHGEAGALAVWALALKPATFTTSWIAHGMLWLDFMTLVHSDAVILAGLDVPVGVPLVQPATSALVGLTVHIGAFQWHPSGVWLPTPATALVLGG